MSSYPAFFDQIPPITLHDPFAEFLGAFANGQIDIYFVDVVRLAGHSCPTIAGAYLMASEGLKALYGDALPQRGNIEVAMQQIQSEGVCGVLANVFSYITGATEHSGFHGLAGQFDRRHLLSFGNNIAATVQFTRKDNNHSVLVSFDHRSIPANSKMSELMSLMLSDAADEDQKKEFHQLWQNRVKAILLHDKNKQALVHIQHIHQ